MPPPSPLCTTSQISRTIKSAFLWHSGCQLTRCQRREQLAINDRCAAQVRLVALPVAGLVLVAAMAGVGMLPQDPLISFVILLQAPTPPHRSLVLSSNLSSHYQPVLRPSVSRATLCSFLIPSLHYCCGSVHHAHRCKSGGSGHNARQRPARSRRLGRPAGRKETCTCVSRGGRNVAVVTNYVDQWMA